MNIRTKTFLIVGALFIVAFSGIALLVSYFMSRSNNQLDTQATLDSIRRAYNIIDNEQMDVKDLATDWAEWNETYQFAHDKNPNYVTSNYDYSTFFNNHLNLVAILNSEGQLIFSKHYSWNSDGSNSLSETDVPAELFYFLSPGSPLLSSQSENLGVKGIISLSGSAMIMASQSILTSKGTGPSAGTLIIGRYFDSHELGRLYSLYNTSIHSYRVNDPSLPADFAQALENLRKDSTMYVQKIDGSNIFGYALTRDIDGQPSCIFKIENSRILYAQARENISYFTLSLLLLGVLFIIVILVTLEKFVISRISKLSASVNNIGLKGDPSSRVALPGKDELSGLATSINGMLSSLEKSRQLQKESESFNSALLRDSPNPIEVLNPEGSIRYVNPALEKITGYSEAQLINRKPPFPWWTNYDTQRFSADLNEISSGGLQKQEKHFRRSNGNSFWVETTSTSIQQENQVQYYISSWVDITERKQAEAALKASEIRFRELAQLLPELVFEIDLEGNLNFVNRVAFSVFGYPNEEASHLKLSDMIAPEDRNEFNRNMQNIIAGEISSNTEYIALRKNGTRFPAFVHATTIKNEFAEQTGLRGILVDITTQKEIESELRTSEEFSSSLRDNAPYPIMVINPDTSIRYVNSALEKLSGFSSSELVGCKIPYPFSPLDDPRSGQTLTENVLKSFKIESVLVKKNGDSFYVDITSSPIMKGNQVNYVLSIWVDITSQKLASEQLEQLYQREKTLREDLQAEIRSRTEFTRALVHELKTPLTPIMASSELLVEELTTEPLSGLARNVHQGAENMNRRVDEMLDLARGEMGVLKVNINPVDMVRLLNEISKYMEPHARISGQTLTVNIPDSLPIVMADDDRVRQILFNLISNSIKYSQPGGYIQITAHATQKELVIEVHDSGRGMTTEEQKKLFQPYYRIEGRERLSGLGLGLALSKNLVELQNGRIWVVSKKGEGSIFAFTLPLRTENQK
jgi:PAS domain S-box-containing protein